MKRVAFPVLATLAVSFAPLAFAQTAPTGPQQPSPQEMQPAAQAGSTASTAQPSTDPSPMASTQTTTAAGNTRLAALVPAGLTPEDACRGFKDLRDCSAALHVAQNLNIPFADLKDRVTSGQSLGTAIHALKPKADSRRETQRAEEQAREDLRSQG